MITYNVERNHACKHGKLLLLNNSVLYDFHNTESDGRERFNTDVTNKISYNANLLSHSLGYTVNNVLYTVNNVLQ